MTPNANSTIVKEPSIIAGTNWNQNDLEILFVQFIYSPISAMRFDILVLNNCI